jgi:hypothetical protein
MLVAVIVRVMPIIPLAGRSGADVLFDDFHTVLAEARTTQDTFPNPP